MIFSTKTSQKVSGIFSLVVDILKNTQCSCNNISRVAICQPLNYPLALFYPHFNAAFQSGVINQSLHKLHAGNRFVIDAILAHTKNPKFSPQIPPVSNISPVTERIQSSRSAKQEVPRAKILHQMVYERTNVLLSAAPRSCCSSIQNLFRFLLDRQPDGVCITPKISRHQSKFPATIDSGGSHSRHHRRSSPSSQSRKLSSGK